MTKIPASGFYMRQEVRKLVRSGSETFRSGGHIGDCPLPHGTHEGNEWRRDYILANHLSEAANGGYDCRHAEARAVLTREAESDSTRRQRELEAEVTANTAAWPPGELWFFDEPGDSDDVARVRKIFGLPGIVHFRMPTGVALVVTVPHVVFGGASRFGKSAYIQAMKAEWETRAQAALGASGVADQFLSAWQDNLRNDLWIVHGEPSAPGVSLCKVCGESGWAKTEAERQRKVAITKRTPVIVTCCERTGKNRTWHVLTGKGKTR